MAPDAVSPEIRSYRLLATAGFVGGIVLASVVLFSTVATWWFGLPVWAGPALAGAAVALHARGMRSSRARDELLAYGLLAVAFAPLANAVPSAFDWGILSLAAGSIVLAVESGSAARRLSKLVVDEGEEAHLERVAGPLRRALFLPIAVAFGLLVLARPFGRGFLSLPGGALAASLEAEGLYGIVAGAAAIAVLLSITAWLRHVRQSAD